MTRLHAARIVDVTFGVVEVDEREIFRAAMEIASRPDYAKENDLPPDFQWAGREYD